MPAPISMAPRFTGLALLTAGVMLALSAFLWTTVAPHRDVVGIPVTVAAALAGALLVVRCWRAARHLDASGRVSQETRGYWVRAFVLSEVAFVLSIAVLAWVAAVPIWYVLIVALATAINGTSYVRRFRQDPGGRA